MQTIYKYPLRIQENQVVQLPQHSQILSVAAQNEGIVLYALVDTECTIVESWRIGIIGTGIPITWPGNSAPRFISTVSLMNGRLMLHVFYLGIVP